MNAEQAIRIATRGDAVLFLGAGFSVGSMSIAGTPLPNSKQLAEIVSRAINLPPETPLTLAAEIFRDQCGVDYLIDLIKPNFTAANPVADQYRAIAALPWRRIYTTNYDDLFEKASETAGVSLFTTTLSDRVRAIPKHLRCCVHLNGYVGRLDRNTADTELKLTDSSYLSHAILDSEWAILLRQDLRMAKSVIFVGYSLYDYEIRKLLIDIPLLKQKALFVIGSEPNPVIEQQIRQYGEPYAVSTLNFGELVKSVSSKFKLEGSPEEAIPSYVALTEFSLSTESEKPTDNDQWKLFFQGVIDNRHLNHSIASNNSFVLRRSKTDYILSRLDNSIRAYVVLGELGNGKTIFLQILQFELATRGYRVFWIQESGDHAEDELITLASAPGKKVFILEGYPDRLSLVEAFALNAHSDSIIILTCRTSVNDLFADAVAEKLHEVEQVEISLDTLDDSEASWFLQLLTNFGMWGDRAGVSDKTKLRILQRDCGSQIQGILLHVLESPHIQEKVRQLFMPLRDYQDVLICLMVMSVLGRPLTTDLLADIVGFDKINGSAFRNNEQIRQLMGYDSQNINVRSPIIAQFYLNNIADRTSILSVLLQLVQRVNKARDVSSTFSNLFESLQRFSIIQRIFPKEGKLASVLSYYEQIKSLEGNSKNYHFWLQYAIACLTLGERERSKKYFDQAFAIAKERNYDSYMVDNHYSRYLLETAVEYPDVREAMECFRTARDIVSRQIRDERMHYPYRVAINYVRFINRFGTNLQPAWVDEIEQAAKAVANRIPELPDERRNNRYVRQCVKDMDYVLYKCTELRRSLSSNHSGD